jgi:hypothetical protein
MRVNGQDERSREFMEFLLAIGNGEIPAHDHDHPFLIPIPYELMVPRLAESLLQHVYGRINDLDPELIFTSQSNVGILTPTNLDVKRINEEILNRVRGDVRTYLSADKLITEDETERALFPIEALHAMVPNNYPPHELNLKKGCVVMCIKNIATHLGLCNGTRLKVIDMYTHCIRAQVMYGKYAGKIFPVSRHRFEPSPQSREITKICRVQFPFKLSFAMTINKSQGQTFDRVAIYLPEPVFAHGQLYVALSRVRNFDSVRLFIQNRLHGPNKQGVCFQGDPNYYTRNIVNKQVLANE